MSKGRHWKRDKNRCVLCGRTITPAEKRSCITGSTGRIVCVSCLGISRKLSRVWDHEPTPKPTNPKTPQCPTPVELIKCLDETIIGQQEAKTSASVALWKQSLRAREGAAIPKTNLLLYGPTGCGKTAIVQAAAEKANLPFISFDASTITENGYKGADAHDVIRSLFSKCSSDADISHAVVFLDEFDKLTARGSSDRQANSRAAQHALLKMLEGETIEVGGNNISTADMLFVLGGAFTGIAPQNRKPTGTRPIGFLSEDPAEEESTAPEELTVSDFVAYGMEPEIMGRIGQCVPVHTLTADDLARILLESGNSVYLVYQRFFSDYGIDLDLPVCDAKILAEEAIARGTGARGLNSLIEKHVQPLLMQLSNGTLRGKVSILNGGNNCA